MTRTKLSPEAESALMKAKPYTGASNNFLVINRTLGYQTWATGGRKGRRRDIMELYAKGLIEELTSPWSRWCVLTLQGEKAFYARKGAAA